MKDRKTKLSHYRGFKIKTFKNDNNRFMWNHWENYDTAKQYLGTNEEITNQEDGFVNRKDAITAAQKDIDELISIMTYNCVF